MATFIAVGAGTAGAAGGPATRDWFHGPFAEAAWQTSPTAFGFMLASREQDGTTHLSVHQFTLNVDSNGNTTGGVVVGGETTLGVSFAIDPVKLTTASASGVVPMSRCVLDANLNATSCTDAESLGVAVNWIGQGPIPHQPSTFLTREGGCLAIEHNSSVERAASTTVVLGGAEIDPSAMQFAGFGMGNGGVITTCPHG
jgi:hypothetical protein